MRNKRKAFHRKMFLTFKKFKKHFSQFIYTILVHFLFPPSVYLFSSSKSSVFTGVFAFLLSRSFFPIITAANAKTNEIKKITMYVNNVDINILITYPSFT